MVLALVIEQEIAHRSFDCFPPCLEPARDEEDGRLCVDGPKPSALRVVTEKPPISMLL